MKDIPKRYIKVIPLITNKKDLPNWTLEYETIGDFKGIALEFYSSKESAEKRNKIIKGKITPFKISDYKYVKKLNKK